MGALEAVRILADRLADPTYGINQVLPSVPRDGGDPAPPLIQDVQDETRDNAASRGRPTAADPGLSVLLADGRFDGEILTAERDGEVTILIRYDRAEADSAVGMRDAYYTMRGVMQVVRVLMSNAHVEARTRNGIVLVLCRDMRLVRTEARVGDNQITSGLLVTFAVRDRAP